MKSTRTFDKRLRLYEAAESGVAAIINISPSSVIDLEEGDELTVDMITDADDEPLEQLISLADAVIVDEVLGDNSYKVAVNVSDEIGASGLYQWICNYTNITSLKEIEEKVAPGLSSLLDDNDIDDIDEEPALDDEIIPFPDDEDDLDDDELRKLDAELSGGSSNSDDEEKLTPEEEIQADDMMAVAATTFLVNDKLSGDEKKEFCSSESETATAIREGFMTEADINEMAAECGLITEAKYTNKMIIRLDAESKKKQLYA